MSYADWNVPTARRQGGDAVIAVAEGRVVLSVLGAVRVSVEGQLVAGLRSRKALALLAFLALSGHPERRQRLVELFWPALPARGRPS